jgi:two-component system CheB/CheR fusion protein
MAAPLIEVRRHKLEIEWPEAPLHVRGDPARLAQVLSNLLNNAARYTADQGVIRVICKAEDNRVMIVVRDTGKGIEPEMQERIFDMFVQGRGAAESAERGMGIGLALARKIVELHGGSLSVHSEGKGRGSEFCLRLARSVETMSPAADAPARGLDPQPQQIRRVLVVDDNADAAEGLSAMLQSLGHKVCVVYDGLAALETARQFRPDVVLLDIGMVNMDGYETARRLRRLSDVGPLKIIAVTGWGQERDRAKSRQAGFDLHLLKPVELNTLAAALADDETVTH